MAFALNTADYVAYINRVYTRIHENGEYISALDAATGDGDHWSNLDVGFQKLSEISEELKTMDLYSAFGKISTVMMAVIGGSSGILYASAYMEAAKKIKDKEFLGKQEIYDILEAMMSGIMKRGKAKPGMKTMLDTLHPVVQRYQTALEADLSEKEILEQMKAAAIEGAERTKQMEAVRGRAYYQPNKGVGHLDPGAVTMCYQIEELADYILEKL